MNRILSILLLGMLLGSTVSYSQYYNPLKHCVTTPEDECLPNAILSAMPFLRIIPDARGGAMGDSGIATSPDPNSIHYNASKLAFVEKDMSFAATYTPWLRNLGLNDVYLAYLSGYKKVDNLQSLGFSLRFFSLGEINFTNLTGASSGTGRPRELEFAFAYARKLSENFSAALTTKYIYSNLASGQQVGNFTITSANAFAADISLSYRKKGNLTPYGSEWFIGGAISNLGSRVTYTKSENKDFLPANFGLGVGLKLNFDEYNSIAFNVDLNKLLIPSPIVPNMLDNEGKIVPNPEYDKDLNDIPDYKEQSMFSAAINSFGDAQGGFSEEIKEINYSLGIEYWYDNQFAVRAGYYYEHPVKGDRQFITIGAGLKYNVFALDLSYLVPTNNRRNPLDNTLRFTLQFDFAALTGDEE